MSVDTERDQADELAEVVRWRRREALEAGLTRLEARLWSEAVELDVGELRRLVSLGCPPELLGRLVL